MWQGVIPAVSTKFTEDGALDFPEMARCFGLMMDAGCDGLIACGSLGEGPMLSHAERIDVLRAAKDAAGAMPALLTVAEAATRDACALAEKAARAGADGLMVVPSTIYHTNHKETVAALRAVAAAGGLPIMIYSNRLAGLVLAFPKETVAIYRLMRLGRQTEALAIYRWFRPLLDLDVSTYLVQNIKFAEMMAIGSNERVRAPRMPLDGEQRARAERIVRVALETRPQLPPLA